MKTQTLNLGSLSSTAANKEVKKANSVLKGSTKEKEPENKDKPLDLSVILADDVPKVELVTENQLKQVIPIKVSDKALREATELMNEALNEVSADDSWFLKENLIGLMDSMQSARNANITDYINASKFVTYKQMGDSTMKAYCKTFPERVSRLEAEGKPVSYLHRYSASYASGSLITRMQALIMVPAHIMHQDIFHQAVRTQADIMSDDTISPKVRSYAANSLMTHLKSPEVKQMELSVGIAQTNEIADLTKAMQALANEQVKSLDNGASIIDIKSANIYTEEEGDQDYG